MNANLNNLPDKTNQVVAAISPQLETGALTELTQRIRVWARELGFNGLGIADTDLSAAEPGFLAWLTAGFHGEMDYMAKHPSRRIQPAELVAGTVRVISVRMAYLPAQAALNHQPELAHQQPTDKSLASSTAGPGPVQADWRVTEHARLADPTQAVISIYARGRDYHKVMRQRLQKLTDRIMAEIGPFGYRVFTDSARYLKSRWRKKRASAGVVSILYYYSAMKGHYFFWGKFISICPCRLTCRHQSRRT